MTVLASPRPKTIPIVEAADRLGVHENTVRNWVDRGVLGAYKTPTGRRKIMLDDVERLAREMYGVPTTLVEMSAATPAPAQAGTLEQASKLP